MCQQKMGIKHLNGYIVANCSTQSVYKCNIHELEGKVITVDISIYLYKFLACNAYTEQLFSFLSLFWYYKIQPVFIFDGKPPPEKWPLLQQRYNEKKMAQNKYDQLQDILSEISADQNEYECTIAELEELRKKMIKIRPEHIEQSKSLMDAFGFTYIEAPCEADMLCAYMVTKEIAWACLSEDMDLFALGCTRVLRNISLLHHNWILYHSDKILLELGLSRKELVEIIVLSGSDYTVGIKDHQKSIRKMLDLYRNRNRMDDGCSGMTVFDWYQSVYSTATTTTSTSEVPPSPPAFSQELFDKHCCLFRPHNISELLDPILQSYYSTSSGDPQPRKRMDRRMDFKKIQELMEPHGFVFI